MGSKEAIETLGKALGKLTDRRAQDVHESAQLKEAQNQSGRLFRKANDILFKYGTTQVKFMGTGAGHDIIGHRLEQVSYLETPPLDVEIDKKPIRIWLSQNLEAAPDYQLRLDSINLASSAGVVYHFRESTTEDADGEIKTAEEIARLDEVLGYLDQQYKAKGIKPRETPEIEGLTLHLL